ncbi:TetR/AcrR family transcriptional regulator [Erwinia sp. AnSW2-5]|uniref:TetR/AcrR family transcriptional regulator n=1 Tax=Erwinia sp. AnSW2-5 TaxID=3367692 RepID=UPI0038580DDC
MKKKLSIHFSTKVISGDTSLSHIRGPAEHEVREQIVRAAGVYFRTFGYEKTTVSELARHIGFSKAYIYKFFNSKQAIGEAIASSCIETIIDSSAVSFARAASPDEKLSLFITSLTNTIKQLLFEEKKLYDIVKFAVLENWYCHQRLQNFIETTIAAILDEGRGSGLFDNRLPVEVVGESIYLSFQSFLNPVMLEYSQDQDPKLVIDLVLSGIRKK